MYNKGYKLFEITDLNRPFENKVLWLVELMFIKKAGVLITLIGKIKLMKVFNSHLL
jgi:hypothetical protein